MKTVTYLLLGEGDFTYSLDMCRYIASMSKRGKDTRTTPHDAGDATVYSVTCTGVDTLEELRNKYKDVDFILRSIQQCSNQKEQARGGKHNTKAERSLAKTASSESKSNIQLTTTILHGINAVQSQDAGNDFNDTTKQIRLKHFDHVMFHHPHLGKEDAQLHSRFLQHLFYAAEKRWLKPAGNETCATMISGETEEKEESVCACKDDLKVRDRAGLLYLTLVNGQCHRWKCIEAAQKHGLVLMRRFPFCPPPPPFGDSFGSEASNTTYYQLRRHQSGKSFAKRRRMQEQTNKQTEHEKNKSFRGSDSETLVFGRACDYSPPASLSIDDPSSQSTSIIGLLPWEQDVHLGGLQPNDSLQLEQCFITSTQYKCSYCSKSFSEERSVKNHMVNSHPDCKEVAAWDGQKRKKKKKQTVPSRNGDEPADVGEDWKVNQQSSGDTSAISNSSGSAIVCLICEHQGRDQSSDVDGARKFPHLQALLDHQRAKHFGSHAHIKPDWYHHDDNASHNNPKVARNENEKWAVSGESTSFFGNCSICDAFYSSELERKLHDLEFIPPSFSTAATETTKEHSISTESALFDLNKKAMPSEQYKLPIDENLQPALNWKCKVKITSTGGVTK
ncbi:hypothetical protein ACHAW6_014305 [Cyclotella cf. meneghiniana]